MSPTIGAPLETFTTGRGDCEDYTIAKYVALRAAGIAQEDVKLIVVSDISANNSTKQTARARPTCCARRIRPCIGFPMTHAILARPVLPRRA